MILGMAVLAGLGRRRRGRVTRGDVVAAAAGRVEQREAI
jgi:hypothetical protein